MIKNSVILIPNISQNKQVCDYLEQTTSILAKYNNRVFTIYPTQSFSIKEILIKKVTKQKLNFSKKINNVFYLYPIHLIPFKRINFIQNINTIIYSICIQLFLKIKHFNAKNYLVWMFFPQLLGFIKIKLPFWKIVYDIVDFHNSANPKKQKQLTEQKKLLLKKSAFIVANSNSLKNKYKILTNKKILVVPQGFSYKIFNEKNKKTRIKLDRNKPLIGFIGQISQRLNLSLLENLISQNKQWSFIFVGPKHHEVNISTNKNNDFLKNFKKIIKHQNCFWFQAQPKNKIATIIQQFDICMIPYDISYDFNRYCYPMKLFEYFYMGKPVLSTPIEELSRKKFKNFIYIGKNVTKWENHIKKLLKKPWPQKYQKQQNQLAINNSWKNKIEAISQIINDKI